MTETMRHPDSESRATTSVPMGAGNPSPRPGLRMWTALALRDLAYAAAVLCWSVAGFTILVTGVAVTASLLVLVVGVPVWIGFVYVLRWTTRVDRALAGWRRGERVAADYRRAEDGGFAPYLKTLSSDPQTWKDMAWLAMNSVVGFVSGLAVVTAAGLVVTYVTMPAWYWAVSHPHSEYGVTNLGLVTVDTLGKAAAASVAGLVMIPFVLLLARGCAAMHAGLAVRLLGAGGGRWASCLTSRSPG